MITHQTPLRVLSSSRERGSFMVEGNELVVVEDLLVPCQENREVSSLGRD